MEMSVYAERVLPSEPDRAFALCTDNAAVERCLKPYGPIPGVVKATLKDAEALAEGVRRAVTTSDGVTMHETVLRWDPPQGYTYQWGGELQPPFAWIVAQGTAVWTLTAQEGGTHVRWDYSFTLTSPLAAPIAWPLFQVFQRWMVQALEGLHAEAAAL